MTADVNRTELQLDTLAEQPISAAQGPTKLPSTPVIEVMRRHRSVRFFDTERALPEGTLEALIAAAQTSSTSSNMQMWSVVVVADPEKRRTIRSYCRNQAFIEEAPLFMVFCADTYRLRHVAERQGYTVNYSRIDFLLAATIDSAIACQSAALAAESLGLGCCMVGGVRNRARDVGKVLGLPLGVFGSVGLAVGYPRVLNNLKPRLPQNVVIHTDRYSAEHFDESIGQYDTAMAKTGIYEARRVQVANVTPPPEQDTGHYGWAEHTGRRLQRGNGSRRDVGTFLTEQGFVLE
jgi:FMN reductase [NAD(P)H]